MNDGTSKRCLTVWLLLFFLVSSFLSSYLTFNLAPVLGTDTTTITINPDGSIDPPTTLISTSDNRTYYLTANVSLAGYASGNPFCLLERSDIVIDGNGYEIQGTGENVGFLSAGAYESGFYTFNVTFRNLIMKSVGTCIDFTAEYVRGATVTHCYFSTPWRLDLGYWQGITGDNNVSDNEFMGYGWLGGWEMQNSIIARNIFSNASAGSTSFIDLTNAPNSAIYENEGAVDISLSNCPNSIVSNNTLANPTGDPSAGAIGVGSSENVTVSGNTITGYAYGASIGNSPRCLVSDNRFSNMKTGYNGGTSISVASGCTGSLISGNFQTDGFIGIEIASNCTVTDNVISNNKFGVRISCYGDWPYISWPYAKIYHNHFLNNTVQAQWGLGGLSEYPSNVTTWDNGYPSGGNYWSDYVGVDWNHDGFGDSPYLVVDSHERSYMGRDRFPFVASPFAGSGIPSAFFNYTIGADYEVTFDGSLSYAALDRTIVNYEWDFGDGTTATGMIVTHKYTAGGTAQSVFYASASQAEPAYSAALKVTDNKGATNRVTRTVARGNIKAMFLIAEQLWSYDATIKLGELIYNKATDFRITYASTFPVPMMAHVKLETPGFTPDAYEFDYVFTPGEYENFVLGEKIASSPLFLPSQKPTVSFRIEIDPYNTVAETDETDNVAPSVGFNKAKVNATEFLRILFVPVRFKDEDGCPDYSPALVEENSLNMPKNQ